MISVCYPLSTVDDTIINDVNSMLQIPGGESAFNDLKVSWPIQLATVFIALALS